MYGRGLAQLASVRPGTDGAGARSGRRGAGGDTLHRPMRRRRGCSHGATPVPAVGRVGVGPTWGEPSGSPSGPLAWPAHPAEPGQDVLRAHPALARVPARRHRVQRLHPAAGAGMVPRGSRRHRPEPGAAAGDVRPRRRRNGPPRRGRLPPGVRARPVRGIRRRAAPPGLHASRARGVGGGQRRSRPAAHAGRPRVHEPRPARRPGWRRLGGSVRRQGARVGARILDARETRPGELGRGGARGGARDVRRLGAHPGGRRGRLRPHRACLRGAAGRRRRAVAPRGARRGARAARRRGGARPAEPRQCRRAAPGRWERCTARRVPRR